MNFIAALKLAAEKMKTWTENNTVLTTTQELTDEQKVQARSNIGAIDSCDDARTFIAVYGTTTSTEINEALDAGKAVFCQNGVYRGTYLRKNSDGRRCVFGYATSTGHVELLCDGDKWSSSTSTFAKSSDLNSKIVNRTATLVAGSWSSNSQTVTVTGITTDNTVIIAPDPTSQLDYTSSNILCSAQAADSLTFTCVNTPTVDITVNIVILN